jgi:hypothetical protein
LANSALNGSSVIGLAEATPASTNIVQAADTAAIILVECERTASPCVNRSQNPAEKPRLPE